MLPSPPPYPHTSVHFCLMIYGFAHTFQREAWSLSDGVSAGFIGFDPPTTSTICTNLATLVRLCIHLCFKWYLRTGATTVISLMYFFRLTSEEIFFFPLPLWPRTKGTDTTRQAWKCAKWPLLEISINPWTSFAVSLVPYRFHAPPCESFPRCLSLSPCLSFAFCVNFKHCNKWIHIVLIHPSVEHRDSFFSFLQHSLLANMWFQILNFDVEGLKKEKKNKKLVGPQKILGGKIDCRIGCLQAK